jgi:hypothetical protein
VVLVSGSGDCSRAWQTVREVLADCPRGGVHPCVLRVRHVFLSAFFLSGWPAVFDRRVFGGPSARMSRTIRAARLARGPSEDVVRTVRVSRCRLGHSVCV